MRYSLFRSFSANADQRSISLTRSEGFPGAFRLSTASILGKQPPARSPAFPHGETRVERIRARSDAHIGNGYRNCGTQSVNSANRCGDKFFLFTYYRSLDTLGLFS